MPSGTAAKPVATANAASRKSQRMEYREQLYGVVRESMIRAGVLSSGYKFKVLSLDPRGRQYLIMMDLAHQYAGKPAGLAEIEAMIAQSAKTRYEILVTSVYWRVNEHVTSGLTKPQAVSAPGTQQASAAPQPPDNTTAEPPAAARKATRYEPIREDEVAAFKQALAAAAGTAPLVASGEIVKTGRRNPAPPRDFEDTEIVDPEERVSPLSSTQYGDLS